MPTGVVTRSRVVHPPGFLDRDGNGPANFIDFEDHIILDVVKNTYRIEKEITGYTLGPSQGSTHSWIKGDEAIVGIRGTASVRDVKDDVFVAGFLPAPVCELDIVEEAMVVLDQLKDKKVIVCGHSLGGAAAFCVARDYENIVRAVSFNGAAPISGHLIEGKGRAVSKFYHIVGDIISTHADQANTDVRRVYLKEHGARVENLNTDKDNVRWLDVGYYHGLERFTNHGREWILVSAQFEQNSLERFFFNETETSVLRALLVGLTTRAVDATSLARRLICTKPIPGSVSRSCVEKKDWFVGRFVGGIFGAVLGLTGGPAGVIKGAVEGAEAGGRIARGEGFFDVAFDLENKLKNAHKVVSVVTDTYSRLKRKRS